MSQDRTVARQAANTIADEHRGAWGGVLLQVDWMAGVIAAAIVTATEPLLDQVDRLQAANTEEVGKRRDAERARDELAAAIRAHRDAKADDRCIEDDDALYEALGDGIRCDRRVGNTLEMFHNCIRFITRRCEGGGWATYAELETCLRELAEQTIAACQLDYHHESVGHGVYECRLCFTRAEAVMVDGLLRPPPGFGHSIKCASVQAARAQYLLGKGRRGVPSAEGGPS